MTELHHHNNNNHSTNNTYNNNNSFDWFDRSNTNYSTTTTTTEQLPPIQMTSATEQQSLGYSNSSQNSNMMDEDIVTTRKSLSSQHPYNNASSSSSSWINNNNTQTTTSTGYSPRDSCDLSYDGEDYHHNHGQPTPSPSASTERSRSKKHRTPSTRDIHVEKNTEGKPPYSYATLIKYAIENSLRKKLTLSEIYQWVIDHYPYYGSAGTGWKNSIRHNLSLNKSFVRVPRPINEPGKGSYWQVDYRAAEAELRTKSTMAVRGRANRSGSDPVGNPYRPDSSWASLNNNNNNANPSFGGNSNGGGQRFHRDSRSLSMDSNMNSNKQGGFSASSSSSSSAAAAAAAAAAGNMNGNYTNGYYGNGYNYNTSSPTTPTRQNNLNNRHSADYSRSSSYIGYDMYANTDGTIPPQQQQQQHYHNHSHHSQQQHHHGHQNNNNRISHQQVPNLYDHQHGHNQPPYGQSTASMYPSGYSNYGSANSPTTSTGLIHPSNINEKEEESGSFSTPQPHYRRVMSTSSPILNSPTQQQQQQTETKYPTAGKSSPSPPQPSMDSKRGKGLNKPCAVGNNNEYDWIA